MNDLPIAYKGEMQLLSWRETHSGGATITLQLSDPSELDAFRSMTVRKGQTAGQRLMVVMVEIGDDECPARPLEAPTRPQTAKGGALARLAGQLCREPAFVEWLRDHEPQQWRVEEERLAAMDEAPTNADEEVAAMVIRSLCGVQSRAELDSNAKAAQQFHLMIREPFSQIRDEQ